MLRNLVLLVSVSLILASLTELVGRRFDLLGISYYTESTRYHLAKKPEPPPLYFRHRPGLDADFGGVSVRTNSWGMRGPELQDSSRPRLLFVGDSVTFGWGVEEEDTFVSRVAHALDIEALNSGVGGYNSIQEAAWLGRYGPMLAPDLVVLLYVPNDVKRAGPVHGDRSRWWRRLALYRLAWTARKLALSSRQPPLPDVLIST